MRDLIIPGLGGIGALILLIWIYRRSRAGLERRIRRGNLASIRRFHVRLERYKLVDRRHVRIALLGDSRVRNAIRLHAQQHQCDPHEVERTVTEYIDEIMPFFNVLSYYRIGYNVARILIGLLFRASCDFRDRQGLERIPRDDVVVYLMNHRSNADYVVVAYVLAQRVSISYAVGEWARVWPLEYVFKSFGAYFVRRRFREPLYHTVLERYVQTITRNGVTQGIFLEGGLSRDGWARPAKVGLLDYIVRTIRDPTFERDIWLVPVALNYDRVLEDRSLIRELTDHADRPGKLSQFATVSRFVSLNVVRLATGNLKRFGRVAVHFGPPQSVRHGSVRKTTHSTCPGTRA